MIKAIYQALPTVLGNVYLNLLIEKSKGLLKSVRAVSETAPLTAPAVYAIGQ